MTGQIRRALAVLLDGTGGDVAVVPGPTDYTNQNHKGFDHRRFRVRVVAPAGLELADAEDLIDELVDKDGNRSVKARLEADGTLDGLVGDVRVVSSTGHQTYKIGGETRLGAEWTVQVLT